MAIPSDPPPPDFGWPRKWWMWLMDLLLWVKSRQPVPSTNDFSVSEGSDGVRFRLNNKISTQIAAAANLSYRLELISADAAGTPKVQIRLGYVGDEIADAGMTDPTDTPPFLLTLPSAADTYYIYCDVTMAYDASTTVWARDSGTPNEVNYSTTAPPRAGTATLMHVYLGAVAVTSVSGGYQTAVLKPDPKNSGDRWVARVGDASTYYDYSG